jgi:hypothetical protein
MTTQYEQKLQNPVCTAVEHFGNLQIDTFRKIKRSPQYFRPPWTEIDYSRFDYNYAQSAEVQASKSTKSTNITAKYTQTDRNKKKTRSTMLRNQPEQTQITPPHYIHSEKSDYHRLTQHGHGSL